MTYWQEFDCITQVKSGLCEKVNHVPERTLVRRGGIQRDIAHFLATCCYLFTARLLLFYYLLLRFTTFYNFSEKVREG